MSSALPRSAGMVHGATLLVIVHRNIGEALARARELVGAGPQPRP